MWKSMTVSFVALVYLLVMVGCGPSDGAANSDGGASSVAHPSHDDHDHDHDAGHDHNHDADHDADHGHDHDADHDHGASHEHNEYAESLAGLSAADRALAERQNVCPVSGEPLGSMGEPFKVTVADRDVLLCCQGCEKAIRENPDQYLAKLSE